MRIFWTFVLGTLSLSLVAQSPNKPSSVEIHHELQKLNFLGTALYIAAHPDDENTRLISYLANNIKARTAYLSLTRGDGGQNLIGTELRELLGVLRTQELLAARRVDGGEQWFTRANDFGFSKHPKETLKIWDKEAVLGDVVWAIRNLRPDVIINRFDHRTPGKTHGHHTSSAILSLEAYELANDASAYPNQLQHTSTWQPKRAFFNTSWWFYGSRENFEKADKSKLLQFDVGVYYPSLGLSNNEIASKASSQHLCQGFGRVSTRGAQDEYVELLKGDLPTNGDIFDGVNTTWSRVKGGKAIGTILYPIENNFDFKNPSKHIPALVKAYSLLQNIEDAHWKGIKSKQLKNLILACGGVYLEANSKAASAFTSQEVTLDLEVLNRSTQNMVLAAARVANTEYAIRPNTKLGTNEKQNLKLEFTVPTDIGTTDPYWLREKGSMGLYNVATQTNIGKAETDEAFRVLFEIDFDGTTIEFDTPVVYKYSKPDKGELYEPFRVLPKVTAQIDEKVILFSENTPKEITVAVRAGSDNASGLVRLEHPKGWSVSPKEIDFSIPAKNQIQRVQFTLTPTSQESEGVVYPAITMGGKTFTKELVEIAYEHIPKQAILLPAETKVVRMDIKKSGERIGYIVGAGDKVPASLEQIGYRVDIIDPASIQKGSLSKYDAVVLGIRAYNVVDELKFKQPLLLDYVKNGGNLVVQYNTASRRANAQFKDIAPYPLTVSRDRVTDEYAEVTILAKDHALVNYPNKIGAKDFNGWVQERGLYFPNQWSQEFTPILSMADEGESAKEGSLLIAPYGSGNYIYTGLSFFRELPAGVPGAYKLFANLLSIGKEQVNN